MELEKLQKEYSALEEESNMLYEEVQNLKDKEEELSNVIENEKEKIQHIQNTIESLQDTLYELEQMLNIHENELENISEQLKDKRKLDEEIDNQLIEKKTILDKLLNEELCKRALKVSEKNSYRAYLFNTSNTIPIITEYCHSSKEFLILDANMYLQEYKTFSYIIVKAKTRIKESKSNVPTMTEIKSVYNKMIKNVTIPRMQWLKNHILSSVSNYNELSSKQIIPLSEPCLIGGQAEINKTGYGWEYSGGYYYEGTNYGEMTGFSVIGIQIN